MDEDDPAAERYAQEHRKFLEENNPTVLEGLRQSGELDSYLFVVGDQANEMFMTLMKQDASSIVFQNLSHIERVQALHARQCEAEEIVRHDVIFQPLPSEG